VLRMIRENPRVELSRLSSIKETRDHQFLNYRRKNASAGDPISPVNFNRQNIPYAMTLHQKSYCQAMALTLHARDR